LKILFRIFIGVIEVIPVINVPDWETAKKRIEAIAPHTDWVEIDISNGTFATTQTWNNPADLKTLGPGTRHLRVAVHLMVAEPAMVLEDWIKAGVRRVIAHYEVLGAQKGLKGLLGGDAAEQKIRKMSEQCHDSWVEFGLAILWRTQVSAIRPYLDLVDMVQVLAVDPGPSGQEFRKEALKSVQFLHSLQSQFKFKIEWDGGATSSNIRQIREAGADIIVAGSAIFGAAEPEKALEILKREALG
jgi:ribulose-phosphate 3-epimerase